MCTYAPKNEMKNTQLNINTSYLPVVDHGWYFLLASFSKLSAMSTYYFWNQERHKPHKSMMSISSLKSGASSLLVGWEPRMFSWHTMTWPLHSSLASSPLPCFRAVVLKHWGANPQSLWFCNSREEPRNLHFYQVFGCCWSGNTFFEIIIVVKYTQHKTMLTTLSVQFSGIKGIHNVVLHHHYTFS